MQRQSVRGFTLIEVMITVVIVAILASIAIASYRSQIVRSNRSAAESFMQEIAAREERFLLDNRQYAIGATALTVLGMTIPPDVSGNYAISIADDTDAATVLAYVISAAPQGGQADDTTCGPLSLDNRGVKLPAASGATARCWQ